MTGPAGKRSAEPFLWLLFSGGGVVAALVAPILLLLFGVVFALGWIDPPSHADLLGLLRNPLSRLAVFGICLLALFHFAHRFRYALWDGLQLKHGLITLVCYGAAVAGSVLAALLVLGL